MFTKEELARAYHAAQAIQDDVDNAMLRRHMAEPEPEPEPKRQRRAVVTVHVEPDTLFLHASSLMWSANRNRTGSKFYLIDGDGREIGVLYSEPDAQLVCQAVNEYGGLSTAEQAREDAVAVIRQQGAKIARLEAAIPLKWVYSSERLPQHSGYYIGHWPDHEGPAYFMVGTLTWRPVWGDHVTGAPLAWLEVPPMRSLHSKVEDK